MISSSRASRARGALTLSARLAAARRRRVPPAAGPHRLLMINHYALTPDMAGGTRHHELATLLAGHGWDATVIATPFNYQEGRYLRPVSWRAPMRDVTESGVRFRWLYSTPYRRNDWRRYLNMVSFLLTATLGGARERRPDVVIGSSPHLFAALAGWIVARRHRVPFVLEVRDLWPESLVAMGLSSPLIIRPLDALKTFLYRRASHIVGLSQGICDAIVAGGVDPARVTLVPNAAMRATATSRADREVTRARLGWTGRTVFIYAGAHGPANGLDQLVAAAARLGEDSDALLVLLGDGPEKPALQAMAAGLGAVRFLDAVSKREVYDVLRAADVGVISLRKTDVFEGVRPNKLFDYMSEGLPVLTTVPGEIWRIVERAGAGALADPESPEDIARAMRRLAADPEARERMGRNAAACAAGMLSREDTAADLARLLDEIVAAPGRAGAPERG